MDFSIDPEAAAERDLRPPEGRERGDLHARQLPQGAGRSADPDPDDPDQLLPELRQSVSSRRATSSATPVQGKLYDPNVSATLEQVARLAGQFARAVILIEGHTDSSMKGRVPVQAVRDLSLARAEAIKRALIDKFKFDPNKFSIEGKGWDEPADASDPNNQALNRRVEISVFPPEQK